MAEPEKWYVNLPNDVTKKHGRLVVLAATPSQPVSQGAMSSWVVAPAVGATNHDTKYLSSTERARIVLPLVQVDHGQFKNLLLLPHVGGDRYIVVCKKAQGDHTVTTAEVTTWRKVYYTVYYMNQQCKSCFNRIRPDIEKVFREQGKIDLELVAMLRTRVDEPKTVSLDFGLRHLYHTSPPLANKPFHLRVVVLNDIYGHKDYSCHKKNVSTHHVEAHAKIPLCKCASGSFLRSANAWKQGSSGASARIDIRSFVKLASDRKLVIDFPNGSKPRQLLDAGQRLKIEIKTSHHVPLFGYAIGNFCCVRAHGDPLKTILQTFTHEVGHSLQQVVEKEDHYNTAGNKVKTVKCSNYHDSHCTTNVRRKNGRDVYTGTLCTLFRTDHPKVDVKGRFCQVCAPRLARVNLDDAHMRKEQWHIY